MTQDDLASWLRVAAENKITTKNTWKSTLIEHFSDISQFRGHSGINFQKAGCTLEGCVKVYSTRVDDVSENTSKLLGMFSREEEPKRPAGRRKTDFIEKNTANINLREIASDDFYDPVFSSILLRDDDAFIVDVLEPTSDGTFIYDRRSDQIIYQDEKIEIACRVLPICASLKEVRAAAPDEDPVQDEHFCANDDFTEDAAFSDHLDTQAENNHGAVGGLKDDQEEAFVFSETPFGYFKGWAGPSHWKVELSASKRTPRAQKPKEKFYMDFTEEQCFSHLFERAETTMSKEFILERRKNKNTLPEDFSYEKKDLYRFILRDAYFSRQEHPGTDQDSKENTRPGDFDGSMEEVAAPSDDGPMHDDIDSDCLSSKLEQSLIIEDNKADLAAGGHAFKAPKAPKRIDITKLKQNILDLINANKNTFSEIYRSLPSLYSPKEMREISMHICLISILHLANEHSFELAQDSNDVLVKR